ncbi:hypothetical protein [Krasilnikovia sp. M28-CT-15]|uniref:hypothetical protein n=1 Tax=Krasilnikovia sp. M28-CT-15 TaxID=3373540 RepID=UPI003875C48B
MRTAYRVLALLIAVGVVVQAATVAYAWFVVLHDTDSGGVFDKNTMNGGHEAHEVIGMMVLPTVAVLLLLVAFFAKVPGGVLWAAITLGVVLLQVVLGTAGAGAPFVGLLHGVNAFAVAGVASVAAAKARRAGEAAAATPA